MAPNAAISAVAQQPNRVTIDNAPNTPRKRSRRCPAGKRIANHAQAAQVTTKNSRISRSRRCTRRGSSITSKAS